MAKESLETLISELIHEEEWRRMRATAACLKGGPKAVEGLIQVLNDGSPALKVEASKMLARIGDPRAGVPLVGLLNQEEAVRDAGVAALQQMAGILDADASTALTELLKNDDLKPIVSNLLGKIPTAIGPLSAMLRDPDERARITAATILEQLLDARSADALVEALGDPVIQDMASRTLKKLGSIRDHIDEVFSELSRVEEPELREGARQDAVLKLHSIGRPGVEIFIEYLDDEDWVVREAAADVLGKIGDVRSVEPLMERLRKDPDTGVKEMAVKGLGLIGDARPVDLMVEALPIKPLRALAIEALGKVKDVELLRPHVELFTKLKQDRDGLVSYNAGIIVDKLEAAALTEGHASEEKEEEHE